jgi:hypothetical protein
MNLVPVAFLGYMVPPDLCLERGIPLPAPLLTTTQVAEELSSHDVIRAHARDELGIDLDVMSNPWQVTVCGRRHVAADSWHVVSPRHSSAYRFVELRR